MADSRNYPDINFVETNTDTIKDSLIQAYELITGRTLYPADPIRIFILWVADIIAQERVLINESAKQNVPRYAEGEYLDSLAEIFKDVERLAPKAATTTLRFTISAAQTSQIIVPIGTRATVDGTIIFETTEIGTITAGNTYVDVSAVCQTVGTTGNGFSPGQIVTAVDVFPYMQSVSNTTTSEGGSEEETDEAFYERMRESAESYSTAGPSGAYEYIAKTVNSLIADVKATSTTAGVVDVYILLQNGQLPGPEILAQVLEALNASKARPLTDTVNVNAPQTMTFNIEFTYYIPLPSAASAAIIQQAVTDAVTAYKTWQTSKMGRDINPSYLISLLMQTGIKRVELTAPVHTVVPDGKVAVFSSQNIVNGGFEDE